MQIHELNNFTGTLGSGAYLAVDDGNDTGKLSTQQLLSATEARIDNIIAGPAPSAEEIVDARLGADGVTYPSLGDAIRDQVSDLKSAISDMDVLSTSAYKHAYGNMSNNGTWNNLNSNFQHIVLPIKSGDAIITSFRETVNIGFLKTYTAPVNGASIDYSSATGFTAKLEVGLSERQYIAPSDANFIVIENIRYGTTTPIYKVEINGYDYAVALNKHIANIEKAIYGERIFTSWEMGTINADTGADVSSTTRVRTGNIDPKNGIKIKVGTDRKLRCVEYYSDNTASGYAWSAEDFVYYPKENVSYVRFFGGRTDDATLTDPAYESGFFKLYYIDSDENTPLWFALGDSITQGFYSANGSLASSITPNSWANIAAYKSKYLIKNYAVGGSGYVHNGTVLDQLNARDHVDTIDFSDADFVTLAYGVNDWKYEEPLGTMDDDVAVGGTIISNMRYVIEKILSDNPLAKLFIITPINCSKYGTQANNWGIGYSFPNNGTLETIYEAEKTVAEYYGIELIDLTHNSVVNRISAPSLLSDGVHPTLDCHKQMGAELSKKINYV